MSNQEFLFQLERLLKGRLPQEELEDVLVYHREYFEEAGPDAAARLDPPEVIARRVLEEHLGSISQGRAPSHVSGIVIAVVLLVLSAVAVVFSVAGLGYLPFRFHTNTVVSVTPVPTATAAAEMPVTSFEEGIVTTTDGMTTTHSGEDLPAFSSLRVTGDAAETVILRAGPHYSLQVTYNGNYETWDYYMEDGSLSIYGSERSGAGITGQRAQIVVTVPDGLDELNIDLGVGDISVSGVPAQTGFLSTDVGSIDVRDADFGELCVNGNTGSITVAGGSCETLSMYTNVGDLQLLKWEVRGELTANTDVGNVQLTLPGDLSDYAMTLSTHLGEITVDGSKLSSRCYESTFDGPSLEAYTNVGDITVVF